MPLLATNARQHHHRCAPRYAPSTSPSTHGSPTRDYRRRPLKLWTSAEDLATKER
jgi:hypothetical protein